MLSSSYAWTSAVASPLFYHTQSTLVPSNHSPHRGHRDLCKLQSVLTSLSCWETINSFAIHFESINPSQPLLSTLTIFWGQENRLLHLSKTYQAVADSRLLHLLFPVPKCSSPEFSTSDFHILQISAPMPSSERPSLRTPHKSSPIASAAFHHMTPCYCFPMYIIL